MKSSGFGWEALFAVGVLAAFVLVDDEVCANAEFVVANAIDMRVITRNVFCFTDSFLTPELDLGASTARDGQQHELSSMHDSTRATSCISQPERVPNWRRGH